MRVIFAVDKAVISFVMDLTRGDYHTHSTSSLIATKFLSNTNWNSLR